MITDGQHWYFQKVSCLAALYSLCAGSCAYTRCKRIAGIDGHIHHTTTLYTIFIFISPFWIDISCKIAIISRVGIDNTTNSAMLLRYFGLYAAPAMPVFGNYNFTFYTHAHSIQHIIIFGQAVVDEY